MTSLFLTSPPMRSSIWTKLAWYESYAHPDLADRLPDFLLLLSDISMKLSGNVNPQLALTKLFLRHKTIHGRMSKKKLARNIGSMSIAVFFSRILGLVRDQVMAFFFGGGLSE